LKGRAVTAPLVQDENAIGVRRWGTLKTVKKNNYNSFNKKEFKAEASGACN